MDARSTPIEAFRWAARLLLRSDPERSARRLVVFTRYPEPGASKTRLIPALGPEGAADLHRRMTEHTLRRVRRFLAVHSISLRVWYEGGGEEAFRRWLGADLRMVRQPQGDLGARMEEAFGRSFGQGMKRVVLIGTDCPGLDEARLARAFRSLGRKDLVLGPAADGGYYLIGLRRPAPELFRGIPWGTGRVLADTLDAAGRRGLAVEFLDTLRDVDRPEDLGAWRGEEAATAGRAGAEAGTLSIIIPAIDEQETIEGALAGTAEIPAVKERIVVDGGSRDRTADKARACGARLLFAPPGRARQMNAGARQARGDVLVFLHADTRLPPGFEHHVQEVLDRPGTVAGAFLLGIEGPSPGLRIIEWLANFRSVCMGMPYGDQAIFVRADRFRRVGGFPEIPIMEDFAFVRRIRRQGRIGIAAAAVTTSARRYEQRGLWRTTWINQGMILGYAVGVPPDRLARWYRGRRGRGEEE